MTQMFHKHHDVGSNPTAGTDFDVADCCVYDPSFLSKEEADIMFERIDRETRWGQQIAKFRTVERPLPRLTAWYGDPGVVYSYTGIVNEPLPWTSDLSTIRERLAPLGDFNSVLLNRYKDGNDCIHFHCDNEKELGRNPTIASITLGTPRTFKLKNKETNEVISMKLEHGSLLVMFGRCQDVYLHGVPREPEVKGSRINLTFRTVLRKV